MEDSIESYIHEIHFMEEYLGQKVPFVIIEESDAETEQRNRALIENLRIANPDILLIHFDSCAQKSYFNYFLNSDIKKEIVDLLHFKGLSYGRIMNKQFLIAATLGADFIHRRDSDTKVKHEFGFPAEMELKYLGKNVSEANKHLPQINITYKDNQKVYVVGSGYSGGIDWKIDYSLFLPDDSKLILEVNQLLGYSDELSLQYYHEITKRSNMVQEKAKYLPQENHSNPDCGNISFYKVHKYFPCSPILNTSGTDYFITNILKNIEFPIVYHNHFVYHGFTMERKTDTLDSGFDYWCRVVNLMDYYETYAKHIFLKLKENSKNYTAIEDFSSMELLEDIQVDKASEIKRKESISKFGDIFLCAKNHSLKYIGEMFKDIKVQDKIIHNSNMGLENHKLLFSEWNDLMKIAEDYNIK